MQGGALMTDITLYVALAWVLSTLGAGVGCYWLGWHDRGVDDREQMARAASKWLRGREAERRGPWADR